MQAEAVTLEQVADVFNGKTPSKSDHRDAGHPVLKIKDVTADGFFSGTFSTYVDAGFVERVPEKHIRSGDILILNAAHSASYVGSKSFFAGKEVEGALATGEWLMIRANSKRIIPDFLFYWTQYEATRAKIRFLVKGIHLYPKDVKQLEVPLPGLSEQRRIVDILNRADGIRRLRKQAQNTARQLIPALFIDMFGDPETNPKGWQIRKVSEFVERFEGGKNLKAGSDTPENYRILKVSAVTSGTYIESKSKPAPDGYTPPESYYVCEGDLLFSRANTEALVGATALVDRTNGKTLLPDKLWRFVWAEEIEPIYIYALFQNPSVRRELSKLSTGTSASMRNISQGKLKALKLPIAPLPEQKQFVEQVLQAQAIQKQQSMALGTAIDAFNSVMARAFTSAL